ncbi:MAG: VCBS repeat-containing protein [Planctomycetes bacterium]|nr:VCBS repeat-containing protein [Planctomycetota bacterium]
MSFGGIPARVLGGDAGGLWVTVPAGAASGSVQVNGGPGPHFDVGAADAAPRPERAVFVDRDLNFIPSSGDHFIVQFTEVVSQGITPHGATGTFGPPPFTPPPPPPPRGLDLPPSGDFGGGAALAYAGTRVVVTLGTSPVIQVSGLHLPGTLGAGPTGLDVSSINPFFDAVQQMAVGGHPLDVEPLLNPAGAVSGSALAVADLDHDGRPDLAATDRVLLRSGGRWLARALPPLPTPALDVAAADFDGDGRADMALACADRERLLVGDGRGGYTDATAARLPAVALPASRVLVVDLDRDGDPDLVSRRVLLNDAGRLREVARLGSVSALGAADLDGDGDLDLLLAGPSGVQTVAQTAPGSFAPPLAVTAAVSTGLATLDLDLDGDRDLAVCQPAGLRLYANDGQGRMSDVTAGRVPVGVAGERVAALDLDGDGLADLVLSGVRPRMLLATGPGAPFIDGGTNLPAGLTGPALATGDLDADGDMDLWLGGLLLENAR